MTVNGSGMDAKDRAKVLSSIWVTIGLLVLAVPNLVAGLWGLIAPENWFDNFPGWAPRLVAAFPPYNEHLAVDAASGLFASGVAAAIALSWRRREVVVVAMAVFLAFALPHAIFHLAHPADALNSREDAVNSLSLWGEVAIALGVMVTALRPDRSAAVYGSRGPGS